MALWGSSSLIVSGLEIGTNSIFASSDDSINSSRWTHFIAVCIKSISPRRFGPKPTRYDIYMGFRFIFTTDPTCKTQDSTLKGANFTRSTYITGFLRCAGAACTGNGGLAKISPRLSVDGSLGVHTLSLPLARDPASKYVRGERVVMALSPSILVWYGALRLVRSNTWHMHSNLRGELVQVHIPTTISCFWTGIEYPSLPNDAKFLKRTYIPGPGMYVYNSDACCIHDASIPKGQHFVASQVRNYSYPQCRWLCFTVFFDADPRAYTFMSG